MGRVGQHRNNTDNHSSAMRLHPKVTGGYPPGTNYSSMWLARGTVRAAPAQIFQTAWYLCLMG